ncbi:TPA: hypothetical protein NKA85_003843 [Vibrio parahaemolyticus]|nr:hypothetical protein [Vibrio parahaemolyticus]
MRFNRIEIDNFMAIGEATIDLDNKGLVLIQGENHDDSSQNSNGAGKCLPRYTILQHAETGERDTIENWRKRFEAGEKIKVWGLDRDLKLRPTNVVDVFDTGEKNILRIHLDDGSYQDVSETHPVVSQLGEVKACSVSIGDYLQAPRHLRVASRRLHLHGKGTDGRLNLERRVKADINKKSEERKRLIHDFANLCRESFKNKDLRNLAESDIKWLKVTKIENIGKQETMDLSVDNDTHLYALDHIITHNSSIVDSIQWAIFNQTARGDSGDAVVNRKAGKNCRVLVQIVDGDREYNIIRHRKHKDNKNRVLLLDVTNRDDVVDLTLGTDKATQEEIDKIIGCSPDVFRAAIYSGQESQIDLPSLTDKHLKTIVEEAAGIDKMQLAHRIARDRYSAAKSELDEQEHALSLLIAKQEGLESSITELRAKSDEFEKNTKSTISELEAKLSVATLNAKEKASELKLSNEEELRASLDLITKRISGVELETKKYHELSAAVSKAEYDLKSARQLFDSGKSDAEELSKRLKNVMSEIGTACDSCGHEITESSISSRRSTIEEKLRSKIAEAKECGVSVKKMESVLSEARRALSEHEASMTDISTEVERQKAIQRELDEWSKKRSDTELAVKEAKTIKSRIEETRSLSNPYLDMITEKGEQLTKIGAHIETQENKVKLAKDALQTAGCVVDVFSPSGIRAHILDTVTPYLNERTAKYLGTLSDGNIKAVWSTQTKTGKGEIREKFAIEVSSLTGGGSYRSLSGGEKRKVRLATALALQDLVSSRASKPIELWIGDEIDDAVDVSGLERLMTVLEEKAKEKGTVLIVSHNQLSDWVRQHATVEKRDGRSTISGAINLERHEELI